VRLDELGTESDPPAEVSIVRVLTPVDLGNGDVPAWRSTTSTSMPYRARVSAVVRPAGPAPTTNT
jgi:hypothetical protein